MEAALWLLPAVGALIGWLTNEVAVRMLFRPKRPWKIPGTGLALQGVLPGRRGDLAASIGKTVADDLLPAEELLKRLDIRSFKHDIVRAVGDHVDALLLRGMPRFMPLRLRALLGAYVRDAVQREADVFAGDVLVEIAQRAVSQLDVQQVVEEKMLRLDLDELERLARRIAGKELRAIVIFGAVLGFVIGLLQMAAVAWLLPARGAAAG